METFLFANANHGAAVWAVACALQRNLIHNGSAVDQPTNSTDIRPGNRRIIENRRVLGFST
jgi:hypothetical protein